MGVKRKFKGGRTRPRKPFRASKKARKMSNPLTRLNQRMNAITRTIETKSGVQTFADGFELGHNRVVTFAQGNLLRTNNGTTDSENSTGTRIGDKITLQRMQIKGMIELNERYSDVSVKVMVIKSAKGDVPDQSNIWQGASANKLLDTFDTERFTILKVKFLKLRAPNMSIIASGVQTVGSGFTAGGSTSLQSRASRMFSITIPGKKFGKNGVVQYENNSQQAKFFDYTLIFFAYSNYSTSDTLGFNVARVNDCLVKLHYKDA